MKRCVHARSCLILCEPMDCIQLGSSVHIIFQARIMDWVASASSRGSNPHLLPCRSMITCIITHSSRICLCQLRRQYMKQMAWPTVMCAHTSVFRSSRDTKGWATLKPGYRLLVGIRAAADATTMLHVVTD